MAMMIENTEKLRIGIVCHPTQGGSGIVATQVGLGLAKRGHTIHFISRALPFRLKEEHKNVVFHEVDVTNYPLFKYPPYTIALAGKLAIICLSEKLDILHVHYAIPHAISAYLCHQLLGKRSPPIVTTLHGTDVTLLGIDDSFHDITGLAINHSEGITAVSNYLAETTKSSFDVNRDIEVIYNFVNHDDLTPELRSSKIRSQYIHHEELLVGHMSNFRSVKRIPDVIRAFHLIQKQIPARLLLIGDGAEIPSAHHMVNELGISQSVEFLGSVNPVGSILAQLDLFLLPSETESFGLAALEAMACGVPVISSNAGGLPEVIEDNVSGLLIEVGDYHGIAKSAIELLKDESRRKAMGIAARKRAVEMFPEEQGIDMYEDYYRRLLKNNSITSTSS